MPPMARSGFVDGVPYSINFKSNLVTVGIGLVGKAERDQGWKVKGNARNATDTQIEEQVGRSDTPKIFFFQQQRVT